MLAAIVYPVASQIRQNDPAFTVSPAATATSLLQRMANVPFAEGTIVPLRIARRLDVDPVVCAVAAVSSAVTTPAE